MWKKRNEKLNTLEDIFKANMGVESLQDVNEWFKKSYALEYRLDRVDEIIDTVLDFKELPIRICGDYDVDGITSTSILYLALKEFGCTDISFRIPKRFSEGFGINMTMIDEIESGLVITVDNGIAQNDVIKYAKDKGLKVIIIDHHLPSVDDNGNPVIPNADIVIDPNAIPDSADFNGYCAAGLAYKIAVALLGDKNPLIPKLHSLATIGTIADVMELKEENYVFVRNGVKRLTSNLYTTVGLLTLMSQCGAMDNPTAKDIAFKVAPVINSSSRMNDDGAKNAVKLLISENNEESLELASKLINLNALRKTETSKGYDMAKDMILKEHLLFDVPIVVHIPDIAEGVVGIIAGHIVEEFKRPCICLTDTEDGILRGSARSCGNYDIKEELDKASTLLLHYGGHTGAAGLSLSKDNLPKLRSVLKENAKEFLCESTDDVYYDLEIDEKDVPKYIDEMSKYEPYGEGNPTPIFRVKNVSVNQRDLIGADKTTVKIKSNHSTAIGFHMAEEMGFLDQCSNMELVGELSNNFFRGNVTRQIMFNSFQSMM